MKKDTLKKELAVGTLLLTAATLLVYMAVQTGAIRLERGEFVATVRLEDAAGLTVGAGAAVSGVNVGRVTKMWIEYDAAVIELALSKEARLRKDVLARIRARSLLGEKYIELVPQSNNAPLLTDGDKIEFTEAQYEIDRLVGQVGPLFDAAAPSKWTAGVSALSDALAEDPGRLKRMLEDLEFALRELRIASEQMPAIARDTRAAASDFRALAADARPLLVRAEASLTKLESSLTQIDDATAELPVIADQANAILADARALVGVVEDESDSIATILRNLSEIDKWELRRLLREEGVLIRMRPTDVKEE